MKTVFGVKEFLTSGWIIRKGGGTGFTSGSPSGAMTWQLGWGKWKARDAVPATGPALYAPDFFLKTPGWIQTPASTEMTSDELREQLAPFLGIRLEPAPWIEPRREEFDAMFATIQAAIQTGELNKAVPIVFSHRRQSLTASARCALILALLDLPESLFGYGFWSMGEGLIGATPEILFELSGVGPENDSGDDSRDDSGQKLSTMALAGTLRKPGDVEAFMKDEKERYEHQLVIDAIRSSLDQLGVVSVGDTRVVELPKLYHLRTDISVTLEEHINLTSLVKALHPTPALGTSPREKFAWLESLPTDAARGHYGAPFVARLEDGSVRALVSIRCLQWSEDLQRVGSGCGIVAASVADKEWSELAAKRESVRAALKL